MQMLCHSFCWTTATTSGITVRMGELLCQNKMVKTEYMSFRVHILTYGSKVKDFSTANAEFTGVALYVPAFIKCWRCRLPVAGDRTRAFVRVKIRSQALHQNEKVQARVEE